MKTKILRFIAVIAAVLLAFGGAMPAFAAGTVTYDGNAKDFLFAPGSQHSPTDLFDGFKNVMPGDTLTQNITVKNDSSKGVKVKLYIRSRGAKEGSEKFLSQLQMKVAKSENNRMAYMFDATGEKTDGLTDWVCLGTLYSGGEVNLTVTLDVPITLGNEFQNAIGFIDWQFRAEEFPAEPEDPDPPHTGSDGYLPVCLAFMAGSGIMLRILLGRKERV